MRVVLLGRKPVACDALRYMLASDAEVVAVSTPGKDEPDPYPERLVDVAESLGIPVIQDSVMYDCLDNGAVNSLVDLRQIDLVISILHQKRILRPLIELGRIGCINFHPAPLPQYRGWGTYNVAILEDVKQWGAAAHFVDENFDTGPLIAVRSFDVDGSQETALSLQRKTQPVLLELFKEVFGKALQDGKLHSNVQGPGRSFSKKTVMGQRVITFDDAPETAERKVRAFWYPPNPCAEIRLGDREYLVMSPSILRELVPLVHAQAPQP